MSISIRTLTPDSSSYLHLRYNTLVKDGEPTIEYARFGSVLLNDTLATAVLAVVLEANPEVPLRTDKDIYTALNQGLRSLIQSALRTASKRQSKASGRAETILRDKLPGLFNKP